MATVGIIANPAAGKDIRRLVAHASTFDNIEKVNIVRRVLLGLAAAGVDEVVFMPDAFGIVPRALRGLEGAPPARPLDLEPTFTQADSTRAALTMRDVGATCIVTLGGDGTNRAVAKGSGSVPLVPISTGTNNVFPRLVEGTVAGLAAGVVAGGRVNLDRVTRPTPCLEVLRDGEAIDLALVDVVVCDEQWVGSRAVWDPRSVRLIVTTRADPAATGFSAVAGYLPDVSLSDGEGYAIELGAGGQRIQAPIAPGLIHTLDVLSHWRFQAGQCVPVAGEGILALDGEREVIVRSGDRVEVRLSPWGPRVADIRAALREAVGRGLFLEKGGETEKQVIGKHSQG